MVNAENLNLFMMCEQLNCAALSELDPKYHIRNCRQEELDIWAAFPFDDAEAAKVNYAAMLDYYDKVYKARSELFFRSCLFVCDDQDKPLATGFLWPAYGCLTTIHWLKTLKDYEGQGIGRALLSVLLHDAREAAYPIYLHTHPACFRAIKLYSDFGFALLTDEKYGYRYNDLSQGLALLKQYMPEACYNRLQFAKAPPSFMETVKMTVYEQF